MGAVGGGGGLGSKNFLCTAVSGGSIGAVRGGGMGGGGGGGGVGAVGAEGVWARIGGL